VLTELGIEFVARQVEPWPTQRRGLRALADTDEIPVLQTDDGRFYRGTREIFGFLGECEPSQFAEPHRGRYTEHRDARVSDATGQMLKHFRGSGGLESAEGSADDAEVVHEPEASRYELRLDRRLVGVAAYHHRKGSRRIAFTHTEVDPSCTGRGFGSRLAAAALDDARTKGLDVVPLCSFIARYIERHPEYEDLLADDYRAARR
jgi:predicted GNAT family acetyltransferase